MSVVTETCERANLSRSPVEQAAFLAEIFDEWAGGNPDRVRRLAAVVLRENGWSFAQIGLALGVCRGSAQRLFTQGRGSLRVAFATHREFPQGCPRV
jgi:DNA-directed RNA polymerase specialized sigma24 family protein